MSKSWQVMTTCEKGRHFVCIYDSSAKRNPYKLYEKWYDLGWHRKKVVEYEDFQSILWHLLQTLYGVRC